MPLVDYLLLTPLDEEWRTVRNVLCPVHTDLKARSIDVITYYLWKQSVNQHPYTIGDYLVVAAPMSRKTPGQAHASVFTNNAVNQWQPRRVILLGIAGSLEPERLQLGDVVVSEEIYGYEVGDAQDRGKSYRPTFNQVGALDYDRIRAFRDDPVDYPKWQDECLNAAHSAGLEKVTRLPELHLEVTASGNYVVKSKAFGRKLRREINSRISAVEMEARGLHQALYLNSQRTDALMIRGISDYADKNKSKLENTTKDAWRTFSAANAARLLHKIWERGPLPPLSPSYQLNMMPGPHTRFRQPGVPGDLEIKRVGAQNIAFPNLIARSEATPELYLEVVALSESGEPVPDFRAVCVIESPKRQFLNPVRFTDVGQLFILPASQWGLRVELLLSLSTPADKIKVICRDDFQRLTKAIFQRRKPLKEV